MIKIIVEQWRLEKIIITVYHDGSISVGDYSLEDLLDAMPKLHTHNCRCALMPYLEEVMKSSKPNFKIEGMKYCTGCNTFYRDIISHPQVSGNCWYLKKDVCDKCYLDRENAKEAKNE